MSNDNATVDPTRVREAVERVRVSLKEFWFREQVLKAQSSGPIPGSVLVNAQALDALCTAALDSLTQRDTVRELSRAAAELRSELEAARAERDRLEERRANIAEDFRLARLDLTARLHTICSELGGLVEGFPTASHNYLQRVRELRQIEAQLSTAQADGPGPSPLCRWIDVGVGRVPYCGDLQGQLRDTQAEVQRLRERARAKDKSISRLIRAYLERGGFQGESVVLDARAALGAGGGEGDEDPSQSTMEVME